MFWITCSEIIEKEKHLEENEVEKKTREQAGAELGQAQP